MRHKLIFAATAAAVTTFSLGVAPAASAQLAPVASMEDQLKEQYKSVKLGADSTGTAVLEAGTVLIVQKGGILGFAPDGMTVLPSKFEDGSVHGPNKLAIMVLQKKENTRFFTVGEKVYPTKIEINVKNEKITFSIVECDSCNGVQQPSFYKSQVAFQFPKGFLETASASQVEDTVGQLFTIDTSGGGDANQSANAQGGNQQQGGGGGQQAPPQQAAPPAEPVQISIGQSVDDVKAAMGNPQQIVNLGAKQIYVYKDLKITFIKGKVTDVQ
jgi:hypothetical protein